MCPWHNWSVWYDDHWFQQTDDCCRRFGWHSADFLLCRPVAIAESVLQPVPRTRVFPEFRPKASLDNTTQYNRQHSRKSERNTCWRNKKRTQKNCWHDVEFPPAAETKPAPDNRSLWSIVPSKKRARNTSFSCFWWATVFFFVAVVLWGEAFSVSASADSGDAERKCTSRRCCPHVTHVELMWGDGKGWRRGVDLDASRQPAS